MSGSQNGNRRPYAEAAATYWRAGWSPIPVRGKHPPVTGYTGKDGAVPSFGDITAWAENGYGSWNIAVRLPDDVIGIDQDHYDGKQGAATIADREARWGALPPTASSTSRTDGSRIRFYRVPPRLNWPGDLGTGSGVEIIKRSHRYAVVWPSIHPGTGATCLWSDPAGKKLDGPPRIGTLAALPGSWVVGLTGGQAADQPPRRHADEVALSGTPADATSQRHGGKHTGLIPYGSRHIELVSCAGSLRRIDLPFEQAEVLILDRLADCAQPPEAPTPVTEDEAIGKLRDVYERYSPRGVPDWLVSGGLEPERQGNDGGTPGGQRKLTLTAASTIRVRRVRWLWRDRVPLGSLTLIGGREGIGKSTIAYTLAADITRGRLAGEYAGVPRSVLVAATEDSWAHTIVPRLMAAGADLDRMFRIDVTTSEGVETGLSLPDDLRATENTVREVDAALILLDPLMSRLHGSLDTHKDSEVRQALEPLVAIADRTGAAILGLIHVNKSHSTDPLTLLMGPRAFAAVARAVLFVMTDPEDETVRLMGQPKSNLGSTDLPTMAFRIESAHVADTDDGPVWTGRVKWLEERTESIREMLEASGDGGQAVSAVGEAAGWLHDHLTDQGGTDTSASIREAGRKAGHSVDALKRAR